MSESSGECVKVVVRCRPMNGKEKGLGCQKIVKVDKRALSITLMKPKPRSAENEKESSAPLEEPKTFSYDNVYDDDSFQKDVYAETAFPLVKSVMEGYNGTIFAYGQTGCGKTFTMEGVKESVELAGIIPRTFGQIFDAIGQKDPNSSIQYLVAVSYIEIYNEEVRDLLSSNPKSKMEIKEDPDKGVFIKGLSQPEVTSVEQIMTLMTNGNKNRSVGATAMNADSSRSHSIFTVKIETSEPSDTSDGEQHIKAGKLNLVDLAGSERQSKTQATGDRLKEAQKINLSLSALGNVISALVVASQKGKGDVHIPYRDSKLTRLLQDSLGGNTKTIMIAAISPADYNYDETLSTLRYANRAKNIKNKPKINEDPKDALLREFQEEIKRLKALLEGKIQAGELDPAAASRTAQAPGGARKKKKPAAAALTDGHTAVEEDDDFDSDEEEEDDGAEDPNDPNAIDGETVEERKARRRAERRARKLADLALSPDERRRAAEVRSEIEEEAKRLAEEKERHAQMSRLLEEQMRVERAERERVERERQELEERMKQLQAQTDEKSALEQELSRRAAELEQERKMREEAANELQKRMSEEKAEHEVREKELAQELSQRLEEEKQRAAELAERMQTLEAQSTAQKEALKIKLKKLQKKMISGGQKMDEEKAKQEEALRKAAEEALKAREKEAREREEKMRVEEEKLLLEESYASVKDEVIGKTKKLKKLRKKFIAAQQELNDQADEFEREREDYLQRLRDMSKESKLYATICNFFLTKYDLDKIVSNAVYHEHKEQWQLPQINLPVFFPSVRVLPKNNPNGGGGGGGGGNALNGLNGHLNGSGNNSGNGGVGSGKVGSGGGKDAADAGWKKSHISAMGLQDMYASAKQQSGASTASGGGRAPTAAGGRPSVMAAGSGASASAAAAAAAAATRAPMDVNELNNLPKRPAFEPAKATEEKTNTASRDVVAVLEENRVSRANFAPSPTVIPAGAGAGASSGGAGAVEDAAAALPRKPAFSPTHIEATASAAGGASAGGLDALLKAEQTVAKRPAFSVDTGASEAAAGGGPQTVLPAELPVARPSFAPAPAHVAGAALASPVGGASVAAADPLATSHDLVLKKNFQPAVLSPTGGAGGGAPSAAIDAILNAPVARPSFAPAPAFPASSPTGSNAAAILAAAPAPRPSFAPALAAPPAAGGTIAHDPLAAAPPPRPSFAPAKIA